MDLSSPSLALDTRFPAGMTASGKSDKVELTNGLKSGFENIYNPEVVELKHEPENFYHHGEFQVANKNDNNTFQGVILQRFLRDD